LHRRYERAQVKVIIRAKANAGCQRIPANADKAIFEPTKTVLDPEVARAILQVQRVQLILKEKLARWLST
jgi:hypothetical protein